MATPLGPVLGELQRAAGLLDAMGVSWALVGGLAVSAQSEPRFTRDVDLAVVVSSDAEAERLILALRGHGYRLALVTEHAPSGRLSTVRLLRGEEEAGGVMLDLLFASSGIEPEIVREAVAMSGILDNPAHVARIGHLIALKTLARDDKVRPQDAADLRALIRAANAAELELARRSLALITERGFDRGRQLARLLDEAIADAAE